MDLTANKPTITAEHLRLIGDKVAVEFCKDQWLGDKDSLIVRGEHDTNYDPFTEAEIRFAGSELSQDLKVGDRVLVKTYAGATPIKFNDTVLKLYSVDDILSVLTKD